MGARAEPGAAQCGLCRAAPGSCFAHVSEEHANPQTEKRMFTEAALEMTKLKAEIRSVL